MEPVYKNAIKKIIKSNALTNNANPSLNRRVSDAVYNYFSVSPKGVDWLYCDRLQNCCPCKCIPTILVILESPHIDEYETNGMPKLPLMNDSNFRTHFFSKLGEMKVVLDKSIYQVVFMNAIQLQCSLGMPTAYYRDYVFLYYWEKLYKNFENRLTSFISEHNVACIVNACTIGGHKNCPKLYNYKTKQQVNMCNSCCKSFIKRLGINKDLIFVNKKTKKETYRLNDFVNKSIAKVTNLTPIKVYKCTHPSSWH